MRIMSDNSRGALLMMGSMAAFTLNDACMKFVMQEIPFFQALLLRGIGASLALLMLAWLLGGLNFNIPRRDCGLVALRTLSEVAATFFFLTALMNIPIANATAILQSLPLSVTLAAALLFGERLGWRRLLAILVGFIGVLIIVRPGMGDFNIFAIYAVIAVGFVTARDLAARRLSTQVPSLTVAFIGACGVTVFAGFGMINTEWVAVDGSSVMVLSGAVLFILFGYLFSVMTMRVGEISIVAPFRYTALIWALIMGFVVFRDWPDGLTILGITIVVTMGMFTFYRERKLACAEDVLG